MITEKNIDKALMERTCESIWANCLKIIRDNINHQSYKTWFEPIKPIKLEENILTIQVPSPFFYEWLEEHFIDLLKTTIKRELGPNGRLEYNVVIENNLVNAHPYTVKMPSANNKAIKNNAVSIPIDINKEGNKNIPNPFIIPGLKKINIDSQLIDIYSFEHFVEGDCNKLAASVGHSIAANPGKTSFNPLFIYSNNGLGKTHLAHAIGIETKNNFPDKMVLYVRSEQFYKQYVDAVKLNTVNDFVHFYQLIDVLIIDDIHDLAAKFKTQETYFHIFNHLHQNGKQIIITSDKSPIELIGFEARLLGRFKWGLAAELQIPDFDTRVAIIKKKLFKDGIEIPMDVIEYLAYNFTTNVREIEGAINSLLAESIVNNKQINLETTKIIVERLIHNPSREFTIDYIQRKICEYFNVPIEMLNSKSRKRDIVQARQLAMFFSKKFTKASLASIGLMCGNKDHATVLHACKTVTNLIDTDKSFKQQVHEIESTIKY